MYRAGPPIDPFNVNHSHSMRPSLLLHPHGPPTALLPRKVLLTLISLQIFFIAGNEVILSF